ncbi:DUF1127 domain-containing protein [Ferrovibrio xuzhouensis]|uniref:DUF1127 domain-containing protein n=1 Tax=Ferrovibrio xuzhouensis TaxID=1576914 RepID=A0ABV7VJX7_9PROT
MNTLRNETVYAIPANLAPLSAAEIEAYARRIRAEAVAKLVRTGVANLKTLAVRFKARQQQRRAVEELNALDDQMLRDIGLSRSQIPAAVAGLIERPFAGAVNENAVDAQVIRLAPRAA